MSPGCTRASADGGATPRTTTGGTGPSATAGIPSCGDASELRGLDGRTVRLVGLYKKSHNRNKKSQRGAFAGEIHIQLRGTPADYNPKGSSKMPAIIELGRRPEHETARWLGKRVSVEGILRLDPYASIREAHPKHATIIAGPPQLEGAANIRAAR